jgi:hypothetical protein
MGDIEKYFAQVNSRNLTDKIISAIDEAKSEINIQKACESARPELIEYRGWLTEHIERFKQAHGVELKVDDPELTRLAVHEYDRYCVVLNLDKEGFNSLFHPHLRTGTWRGAFPKELKQGQSSVESEVEVVASTDKVYVFLETEQAANTLIAAYLQRKQK